MKAISVFITVVSLALTACSSSVVGGRDGRAVEQWDNFDPIGDVSLSTDENRSRVVFVREENDNSSDDVDGPAVNIFVNREYLTSLLPQGASSVEVCSGSNNLIASFTDVEKRYLDKLEGGQIYDVVAGKVTYFQVKQGDNGQLSLRQITEDDFKNMSLYKQDHTLSRVERVAECAQPKVLDKIVIEMSALFKFDRSNTANMLPTGKREIERVADLIKAKKMEVERIDVIGYTDPDGTVAYNEKLSQRRATTIRQLLISQGVEAGKIHAEGRGESNLVIQGCYSKYGMNSTARHKCNQPNRRVEFILYGKQNAQQ